MSKTLELVASLPTTTLVNKSYYKDLKLPSTLSTISTVQERLAVQQQLSNAEKESIYSQHALIH